MSNRQTAESGLSSYRMKPDQTKQLLVLTMVLILGGCSRPDVELLNAWIPVAPPNVRVFAGYFVLRNHTAAPLVLQNASTGHFAQIEFHRTKHENGIARMIREQTIVVSPNSETEFQPGGYHLMLINPATSLNEGETVPITLSFSGGRTFEAEFTLRRHTFEL